MIRRRDMLRLSLQKLRLRKKRAAFSVISIALGMLVVVAVNSLVNNVRDFAMRTQFTEEIDRDVIRVYALESPYEYESSDEKQQKEKRRFQFLTNKTLEEIRGWSEVAAAEQPVIVEDTTLDVLNDRPRRISSLTGVPDVLLRRYVGDTGLLAGCTNAIPIVLGDRQTRLVLNPQTKKMEVASPEAVQKWLGRDVTISVGDPYSAVARYRYDYQKKVWEALSAEELAQARAAVDRSLDSQYDRTIYNKTLTLRGRVVGFCPGKSVLLPLETAQLCAKWLKQREDLASVLPRGREETLEYGARGRRTPKAGEFQEAIVVVKPGVDMEAVAKRIEKLGFTATTRASAFESFTKEFDAGLKIVKRIVWAFGAVILGLACGMLWSTTSRIVSDSRVDIGLFRALGATKSDIRRLFLSESVWLGLFGTLAGMFAGWTLAYYISQWGLKAAGGELMDPEDVIELPQTLFSVDWKFSLTLLAAAIAVSLLAGLWPAMRAANVDPVKALKRE